MKIGALVAGFVLFTGLPLGAKSTLDLQVSPMVAMAPATLRIRIAVPPDAGNRAIAVFADSEAFFRSSQVPLEGESAPRTLHLDYRSMPPGTYQISSLLLGAGGKVLALAQKTVTVIGEY